jgi:mRNA interferase HigB
MRVIKPKRVEGYASDYPDAARPLAVWLRVAKEAVWGSIDDVRQQYSSADGVKVESRKIVTVFNICGNKYRLIVAIHYNTRKIFVLRFLTHAEYDKEKWKEQL